VTGWMMCVDTSILDWTVSADQSRSEIVVAVHSDVIKWDCVSNVSTEMSQSSVQPIILITSVAWSPDSRYVAVGSQLAELKVS